MLLRSETQAHFINGQNTGMLYAALAGTHEMKLARREGEQDEIHQTRQSKPESTKWRTKAPIEEDGKANRNDTEIEDANEKEEEDEELHTPTPANSTS